jgi:hypothetical protein
MTTREETCFEMFDAGDIVRLEPIELIDYGSDVDWDKNWVKTRVTIKSGKFSGQYKGDFMTVDFEKLKQELSRLYENLKGTADFADTEGYLELKIKGDGLGHFEVNVSACDQPTFGNKLTFTMAFDQTTIKELVGQLDRITRQFPIIGNFNIKNE